MLNYSHFCFFQSKMISETASSSEATTSADTIDLTLSSDAQDSVSAVPKSQPVHKSYIIPP